jgi:hypothetical protein
VRSVLIIVLVLWCSVAAAQTGLPQIYSPDGTYLGNLSSNRFDPNSVSNPYGVYGSPYGNGIKNPYSAYGSPFSPLSLRILLLTRVNSKEDGFLPVRRFLIYPLNCPG